MSAVLPDRPINRTADKPGVTNPRRSDVVEPARASAESRTSQSPRWPDDFISLDEGQLWIHPNYAPLFERLGWNTFHALLAGTCSKWATSVRERHRPGGWDNLILEIPVDNSSVGDESEPAACQGTIRLHVKRHRPDRSSRPRGLEEANAIGACQAAAVSTMEIAALGLQQLDRREQNSSGGSPFDVHQFDSIFVSVEIANAEPASTLIDRWVESCGGQAVGSKNMGDECVHVIDRVAATAARMHGAGLFHGDCHWPHFFLADEAEEAEHGKWAAQLIDLQGLQRATGLRGHYLWIKDMAQLRESCLKHGVWNALRETWTQCYNRHAEECGSPYRLNRWTVPLIAMRGTVRDLSVRARRSTRARRRRLFDNHPAYHSPESRPK